MGQSEFTKTPKSIIDAFHDKNNYLKIFPDSHFWIDLNQIINEFDYCENLMTKEYILIGLNNTIKNGYDLKQIIKSNRQNVVTVVSINEMIEYIKDENYHKGAFYVLINELIACGYNLTNGKKMERKEIYSRIDDERNYQDSTWSVRRKLDGTPDEEKPVAEWILYMEYHLNKAKNSVYHLDTNGALAELRKVTALGVRTMEIHGCPERIMKLDHNPDTLRDGCCGACENC